MASRSNPPPDPDPEDESTSDSHEELMEVDLAVRMGNINLYNALSRDRRAVVTGPPREQPAPQVPQADADADTCWGDEEGLAQLPQLLENNLSLNVTRRRLSRKRVSLSSDEDGEPSTSEAVPRHFKHVHYTDAAKKVIALAESVVENTIIRYKILDCLTSDELRRTATISKEWMETCYAIIRKRIGNKPFLLLWRSYAKNEHGRHLERKNITKFELGVHFNPVFLGHLEPDETPETFQTVEQMGYSQSQPRPVHDYFSNVNKVGFVFMVGTLDLEFLFCEKRRGDFETICSQYGLQVVFIVVPELLYTTPNLASILNGDDSSEFENEPKIMQTIQSLCIPENKNLSITTCNIPLLHNDGIMDEFVKKKLDDMFVVPAGKKLKALIVLDYQANTLYRENLKSCARKAANESDFQVIAGIFQAFGTTEKYFQSICTGIQICGNAHVHTMAVGIKSDKYLHRDFKKMTNFLNGSVNRFVIGFYQLNYQPPMNLLRQHFKDVPFFGLKIVDGLELHGSHSPPQSKQFESVDFEIPDFSMVFLLVIY